MDKELLCSPSHTHSSLSPLTHSLCTAMAMHGTQQQQLYAHQQPLMSPIQTPACLGDALQTPDVLPPLPQFLTTVPEDFVQDSEWANAMVHLELGHQHQQQQQWLGGVMQHTRSHYSPHKSSTADLEALLQQQSSEGGSEDLAALSAATAGYSSSSSVTGGQKGKSNEPCRGRRSSCWPSVQGRGSTEGVGQYGGKELFPGPANLSKSAQGAGQAAGCEEGSGFSSSGVVSGQEGVGAKRGTYRSRSRRRVSDRLVQQQLSGFQQQFTSTAKIQCRGIKGSAAVARQNNAILQRLDARLSTQAQGMEQMHSLIQATSQMAEWAQQVQSLSRELNVWKNECQNKHEMWIQVTELLQDREHHLLLMQSDFTVLQEKQRAQATNNDKELLHHSQHELQNVTEALLASQQECKVLQQALQHQHRQQHQQQVLQHQQQQQLQDQCRHSQQPASKPAAEQALSPGLGKESHVPPLPPVASTHGVADGGGRAAARLLPVPLAPAPATAGRRTSDGISGDPDVVMSGGEGGGVVAEALVNAHMSELTQSSGTARSKEVDRVIRKSAGLLKKFVEKNNVQMRDKEGRIAELKKRCRELEAALETLTASSNSSPYTACPTKEPGSVEERLHGVERSTDAAVPAPSPAAQAAGAHAATDARGNRAGATAPSGSHGARPVSREAAVTRAVALLQQQGPEGVKQRHVGVQATGAEVELRGTEHSGVQPLTGGDRQQQQHPSADSQLASTTRSLKEAQSRADQLQGQLEEALPQASQLQSQLEDVQAKAARSQNELHAREAELHAQVTELQRQLQKVQQQAASNTSVGVGTEAAGVHCLRERLERSDTQVSGLQRQVKQMQLQAETCSKEQEAGMTAQAQQLVEAQSQSQEQASALAAAVQQLALVYKQSHEQATAREESASGAAHVMTRLVKTEARLLEVQGQVDAHIERAAAAQARIAELEADLLGQATVQRQDQEAGHQQQQPLDQTAEQLPPKQGEISVDVTGLQTMEGDASGSCMQLVLARSRVSALEAELQLMQQRMQDVITLARGAAQQELKSLSKSKDFPHKHVRTIRGQDLPDPVHPSTGRTSAHLCKAEAGSVASASLGPASEQTQGDAVLSLLGVLRGLESMHTQKGGLDASLQRVRLLQGQMESVLLATSGHCHRPHTLDGVLHQAVCQAAKTVALPLPDSHSNPAPSHKNQQLQSHQQHDHPADQLDHTQQQFGRGTAGETGVGEPTDLMWGGISNSLGAGTVGGAVATKPYDDLLGLDDCDWGRLPAFTPPPDFS